MTKSLPVKEHRTRTRYRKSVKPPSATMLKPGANNKKLGSKITTGAWKGAAIYSLTLEERNSCPTHCDQWDTCYGNNMPFATRYDHTHPDFYRCLDQNVKDLIEKHIWNKDQPIAFRLHVLGDFFDVRYVEYWDNWLQELQGIKIWGYTHHDPQSKIGLAIREMNLFDNCHVRFSDKHNMEPYLQANVIAKDSTTTMGIICPEQTNATASCSTCSLCWSTNQAINFLQH